MKDKPKLDEHVFAVLTSELRELCRGYHQSQQIRAHIADILKKYITPETE